MNDITRIHIAKTAYDIEVGAKKELRAYIDALSLYADSPEWLDDIEVRMTELLSERGINKGDVISEKDVAAIRAQLGEPEAFLGEGDMAVGPELKTSQPRRFYRDGETAVLGGVFGGIAKYFSINPLWIRLAFVFLLAISFGTAFIVYCIIWFVTPLARTHAEKLQLIGAPVTLTTLKTLHAQEGDRPSISHTATTVRAIIRITGGVLTAIIAVLALVFTAIGTYSLYNINTQNFFIIGDLSWLKWVFFGLVIVGGVLFTTLMSLLSYALFKKRLAKKLLTAIITIIIVGTLTFITAIGTFIFVQNQQSNYVYDSRKTTSTALPNTFKTVTTLQVNNDAGRGRSDRSYVPFEYIVDTGTPRVETTTDVMTRGVSPIVTISDDGKSAVLSMKGLVSSAPYTAQPMIRVYGPALTTLALTGSTFTYTTPESQSTLDVTLNKGSLVVNGAFTSVTATNQDGSLILDQATIESLTIDNKSGSVTAGVVRQLTVTQPDACPAGQSAASDEQKVVVSAVSSGTMTLNGNSKQAATTNSPCSLLIIGDEETDDHPSSHLE